MKPFFLVPGVDRQKGEFEVVVVGGGGVMEN